MKILFVCLANIQRSQFAEAFFNRLSNGIDTASSAGLLVSNEWKGLGINEISEMAVSCMSEIGYDISHNKPRQLTEEIVEDSDKVIVLERENWPDYLKRYDKVVLWDLEDPSNKDMDFRRKIRDEIKRLVKNLIDEIES